MAITDTAPNFGIGRVVSRTFVVSGRNAVIFLIVAALAMLPVLAVDLYAGSPNYVAVGVAKGWIRGTVAGLLPFVCTYLLQAALVQATIADLNGTRPSLGGALSSGFALFLPVSVIALVSLLGIGLSFILLVVPGLIVMTGWCVVIPVRVAEHTTIGGTFGRSWELTKGYRWKIFALLLMYGILALLLGYAVRIVTGVSFKAASTLATNMPFIVLTWAVNAAFAVLSGVGVAAIYYELRTVKEGLAPEQLAAAFD